MLMRADYDSMHDINITGRSRRIRWLHACAALRASEVSRLINKPARIALPKRYSMFLAILIDERSKIDG